MKKTLLLLLWITLASVHSYATENTISTLSELKKSQNILKDEIQTVISLKKKSVDNEEKELFDAKYKDLQAQVNEFQIKFEKVATGIDTSIITTKEDYQTTTLSEDFQLLIKPLIHAARQSTEAMRKKSKLQDEIAYYENILFYANKAQQNIKKLIKDVNSTDLKNELIELEKQWNQKASLIVSNLNATQQHMEILEQDNVSFSESFQNSFKNFFQRQGLVLLEALGALFIVIILMQTIHMLLVKIFPILVKSNRTFSVRFLDLVYWVLTGLLAIFTPMAIFYYEENWVCSGMEFTSFGVM